MSEIPGLPLRSRWFRQGRLSQMALITGSSTTSSGQSGSSRWTKPLSFLRLLSNIYINIQVGPWHYLWLRTSNILELLKLRYFDFKDCSWTDGFVVRASHISELGESILCIRKSSSLSSDARYFKCGMLFSLISRYLTGFRALNISSVCSFRQDNIFLELAMFSRTRFVWDRTRVRNPSGDTEVQPERFRLFSWSPSHSHRSCRYLNYQLHYISYMKRSNYFSQKHSNSIPLHLNRDPCVVGQTETPQGGTEVLDDPHHDPPGEDTGAGGEIFTLRVHPSDNPRPVVHHVAAGQARNTPRDYLVSSNRGRSDLSSLILSNPPHILSSNRSER